MAEGNCGASDGFSTLKMKLLLWTEAHVFTVTCLISSHILGTSYVGLERDTYCSLGSLSMAGSS